MVLTGCKDKTVESGEQGGEQTEQAAKIDFVDSGFKRALLALTVDGKVGSTSIDADHNGEIDTKEAAAVTSITVNTSVAAIKSLADIKYFTALQSLNCAATGWNDNYEYVGGSLTALDLSVNTKLTRLDCRYNNISSLDLSKQSALAVLSCSCNKLTSLDLSNCPKLDSLECYSNAITSVALPQSTTLTYLDVNDNKLTSLDLSHLTALKYFYCSYNNLTTIDAGKCSALNELYCISNRLTSLNVSECAALLKLYCNDNRLTSIDLSHNVDLIILWCHQNLLKTLDVSHTNLQNSYLGNALCCAPMNDDSGNNTLTTLYVAADQVIRYINGSDIYRRSEDCIPAQTVVWVSGVEEQNIVFEDENFKKVLLGLTVDGKEGSAPIDSNGDGEISNVEAYAVYSIKVDPYTDAIKSLADIKYFVGLDRLECNVWIWNDEEQKNYYGSLTTLDLSANTRLRSLDCSYNALTSLNLTNLTKLQSLECHNNQLETLDVSDLESLTIFTCNDNLLRSLDVSKLVWLKHFECYKNSLTSLDMGEISRIQLLYCYSNKLSSLDLSHLTSLVILTCSGNPLNKLDVSSLTKLTELTCGGNGLTTLDVGNLTSLRVLSCSANALTSLDLTKLTALQELSCGDNRLRSLDLSNLTSLKVLICYQNLITSLDVSNTNMQNYSGAPLCCSPMNDSGGHNLLETLYIAKGQVLKMINGTGTYARNATFIPAATVIVEK